MIYLASQSPRRQSILKSMKVAYQVVRSNYEEVRERGKEPHEIVLIHALGKARMAILPQKARWVLGSDTLVWSRGCEFGKPKNVQDACQMLRKLCGKWHDVYSGIALWDRKKGIVFLSYDVTRVFMKSLNPDQIRHYVIRAHSLDKAGAYGIQSHPKIVKKIQGSYSNVMGFPREMFRSLMKSACYYG